VNEPVDLPDVNVWLALSVPEHLHRPRAGGFRLVSFDRDFRRFRGLDFLHLTG
jgi:hypothetical protein